MNNDLPGPLLRTNDELIEAIKQIDLTVENIRNMKHFIKNIVI